MEFAVNDDDDTRRAIAAELRAQAEFYGPKNFPGEYAETFASTVADRLRARADDLDPPAAPPRRARP